MEIRNPQYNRFGNIDCELNHPKLGWIPYTIPTDKESIRQMAISLGPAEYIPPPPPTPEEIEAEQQAEIDTLTDQISNGKSIIRALGVKVFQLEKAANPTLTPLQFKQSIRAIIEGF